MDEDYIFYPDPYESDESNFSFEYDDTLALSCNYCKRPGHMISECPVKGAGPVCYRCNLYGHIARDCIMQRYPKVKVTIYEAWVGGLPLTTTREDLEGFFEDCNPKKIGTILKKAGSAYCFVEFYTEESLNDAFMLDKKSLNGKKILVKKANSAGPNRGTTRLPALLGASLNPVSSLPAISTGPPFMCVVNNLNLNMSATQIANSFLDSKVTKIYLDAPTKRVLVEFLDSESLMAALQKDKREVRGLNINVEYASTEDLKVQATLKAPYICPATTPLSDKEVFDFPFLKDAETIKYIKNHGKIFFLVRGPSKTRKDGLISLLSEVYSAQSISPNHYFDEPLLYDLNMSIKDRILNKQAHHWCLYNVKTLIDTKTSCIIVSTTACHEWQMDFYMDQILKNGYTPIIAETTRKIEPPLESSKKKGREETELEPYVPWYYGWFLNPKDSNYITKLVLEAATELAPHVWKDLELPSADADLSSIYIQEPYIFAMCRYCFGSKSQVGTRYYFSHEVTKHMGKVALLTAQFFLIDKFHIWALVEIGKAEQEAMEYLQHLETDEADGIKELKHLDCVVKYPNIPTPSSSLTVTLKPRKITSQIKLTKMIIASTNKAKFPYEKDLRNCGSTASCTMELIYKGAESKFYRMESRQENPLFLLDIRPNTVYNMNAIYTGLY